MKRTCYTALLGGFLFLAGCGLMDYATHPQIPPGSPAGTVPQTPIVQVIKESAESGMSGWATGGIAAGVLGAIATFFKSGARVYAEYNASKPAVPPVKVA